LTSQEFFSVGVKYHDGTGRESPTKHGAMKELRRDVDTESGGYTTERSRLSGAVEGCRRQAHAWRGSL